MCRDHLQWLPGLWLQLPDADTCPAPVLQMTIKDKFLSKPISELDLSGCEVRAAEGVACSAGASAADPVMHDISAA